MKEVRCNTVYEYYKHIGRPSLSSVGYGINIWSKWDKDWGQEPL